MAEPAPPRACDAYMLRLGRQELVPPYVAESESVTQSVALGVLDIGAFRRDDREVGVMGIAAQSQIVAARAASAPTSQLRARFGAKRREERSMAGHRRRPGAQPALWALRPRSASRPDGAGEGRSGVNRDRRRLLHRAAVEEGEEQRAAPRAGSSTL